MKRMQSGKLRFTLLVAICATLLAIPFASPALAGDHGHDRDRDHDHDFHGRTYGYYPAYGLDWGWGWNYGWGGPFWDGYWPYYSEHTGTIKLENVSRYDEVYINGSRLGEAKRFRSIHLKPGTYEVTLKNNGKEIFQQKVFLIRGKTTKLEIGDKHGTIKIKAAAKDDRVYINGQDQGRVKDVGSIHLRPGTYDVAVMNHGKEILDKQITLPMSTTVTLRVGDRG